MGALDGSYEERWVSCHFKLHYGGCCYWHELEKSLNLFMHSFEKLSDFINFWAGNLKNTMQSVLVHGSDQGICMSNELAEKMT